MLNIARFALQALTMVLVFLLMTLGLDWIQLGYGLNPWIAFPISFVLTYIVVRSLIEDIRHQMFLARAAKMYRQQSESRRTIANAQSILNHMRG